MWRVDSVSSDDTILLYKPSGAPYLRPAPGEGLEGKLAGAWSLVETSNTSASLVAHRPGRWSSVWLMWSEGGQFGGWYVNLEEPWRELPEGYETVDLALDIVVQPSGEWAWKDRDEFDDLLSRHFISEDAADAVLTEGGRLLDELAEGAWVFAEQWASWTPPDMPRSLPPPSK